MSFSQPYSEYRHYQLISIKLKVVDVNETANCDLKSIYISKSSSNYIATRFYFSSAPDPCVNGYSIEKLVFPYNFIEVGINSENYKKVVVLFDGWDIYFHDKYSIDKTYFDFKKGIVGFDDTANGSHFRIVDK